MSTTGSYCKAYYVNRFREFSGWREKTENLRQTATTDAENRENELRRELKDDDHLFLHDNLIVTDGIFLDENIIFEDHSPEWKQFCECVLDFRVPAESQESTSAV